MEKTWATRLILIAFRLVPLEIRKMFFKALLAAFYYVSPKQRLIVMHNLIRAFPEKPLPELIGIARGVYRNMGIIAAEFFEIPYITKANIQKYVEFDGVENFNRAYEMNKGVLSIVAHFGNWEMMTVAFALKFRPINIVYRPFDSPVLERFVGWVRGRNGNRLLPKEGSALKMFRLLKRKEVIGILVDQNMATREGIFVDFFGRPACTAAGLAFLALKSGAPVIPAFMIRMESGRYKFHIAPPVDLDVSGDRERDLLVNTQKFTSVIEEVVREYPDQYFWMHQRWKTQLCQAVKKKKMVRR
jgi:KDO2-lipid IV(A) lauroyltransferase